MQTPTENRFFISFGTTRTFSILASSHSPSTSSSRGLCRSPQQYRICRRLVELFRCCMICRSRSVMARAPPCSVSSTGETTKAPVNFEFEPCSLFLFWIWFLRVAVSSEMSGLLHHVIRISLYSSGVLPKVVFLPEVETTSALDFPSSCANRNSCLICASLSRIVSASATSRTGGYLNNDNSNG